jgi:Condensation domain
VSRPVPQLSASQLALLERMRAGSRAGPAQTPISPADPAAPVLSSAQQRIWFFDQMWPGTSVQNLAAAFHLDGPLDVSALRAALTRIVARHQILRTGYRPGPAGPQITASGSAAPELAVARVADGDVPALAGAFASEPIDLSGGPVRWRLLRLAADRHVLLIACHHIAFDGWSLGVLVRELSQLYVPVGHRAGPPPEPLGLQYADFAQWQQDRSFDEELRFWTRELATQPPPLDFPTGRPRPERVTFRGRLSRFGVDPADVRRLAEVAHRAGAPPFSLLIAVFGLTLASCTGEPDMMIGAPVANRVRPELERLIGVFINTVCLRVSIEDTDTFHTLLHRANRTCQAALGHAEVPFEQVVQAVNPPRDPSRNQLFQAMLVYQNSPLPPLALPGLEAAVEQLDTGASKFDLTLYVEDTAAGGYRCYLEYNTGVLDTVWADRIAERFRSLLAVCARDPEVPVAPHWRR